MNLSALITGHETVGDHTEFVVQISCCGVVWLISRRFSDFDQLHCRVESNFQERLTVRLPEKQWFGRFDPNFISKRQAGLQIYLDGLLQISGISDDRSIQHFFEIEKNVELHSDHVRNSMQSIGSNGQMKQMSESDRWHAIVEKTSQAMIDISEVPEPLENDQAVQKRNEILSAYAAKEDNDYPIVTLSKATATLETTPLIHGTATAWLQDLHSKLIDSTHRPFQPPNEDLVAYMPSQEVSAH